MALYVGDLRLSSAEESQYRMYYSSMLCLKNYLVPGADTGRLLVRLVLYCCTVRTRYSTRILIEKRKLYSFIIFILFYFIEEFFCYGNDMMI
jgi:hypothetical protein